MSPTTDAQCLAGAATTGEPGALLRGGSFGNGHLPELGQVLEDGPPAEEQAVPLGQHPAQALKLDVLALRAGGLPGVVSALKVPAVRHTSPCWPGPGPSRGHPSLRGGARKVIERA